LIGNLPRRFTGKVPVRRFPVNAVRTCQSRTPAWKVSAGLAWEQRIDTKLADRFRDVNGDPPLTDAADAHMSAQLTILEAACQT